jgi:signal transduction histidine kinase
VNRAFISLYLFLVVSVVVIGWGLNQLWEGLAPKQDISAEIRTVFEMTENELLKKPNEFFPVTSDRQSGLGIELLSLDDIAKSEAMKKLIQGEIVTASSEKQLLWYKRVADSRQVIMLSKNIEIEHENLLTRLLLIAFYFGLALVIYIWIWPLSRDAKKLEQQTQSSGQHQLPEVLTLSPRSTLYPLARAFNNMVYRLRDLIASHQDMTNAVSHELRTPLARMKFALALIDAEKMDDKSRKQLQSLSLDVHEMESLIHSLLNYAGFEQHTRQLQFKKGSVGNLLENLQDNFSRTQQQKLRPYLQLDIQDLSAGVEFECEWKLIETALQNLLSNAAKFAVSRIRIEACIAQNQFQIRVDDDGPGIPIEERQRVLESFVRLYDEQNDIQTSGFGLGLAIVKRIMQWHQGGVNIEQAPELGGARLVLFWPKIY